MCKFYKEKIYIRRFIYFINKIERNLWSSSLVEEFSSNFILVTCIVYAQYIFVWFIISFFFLLKLIVIFLSLFFFTVTSNRKSLKVFIVELWTNKQDGGISVGRFWNTRHAVFPVTDANTIDRILSWWLARNN